MEPQFSLRKIHKLAISTINLPKRNYFDRIEITNYFQTSDSIKNTFMAIIIIIIITVSYTSADQQIIRIFHANNASFKDGEKKKKTDEETCTPFRLLIATWPNHRNSSGQTDTPHSARLIPEHDHARFDRSIDR